MNLDILQELDMKLPYKDTPEDKELRSKQWNGMDVNGNGYLSLAEIDKGLRDVIRIPQLFDTKPVIMRSYQTAKTALPSKNPHGDDYISKAQYKYLLKALRQYYEYWIAFRSIDKDFDRRVTKNEFAAAIPVLKNWGIQISNPEITFKQIDRDGAGMILFDEFCAWAIKKNLDIEK